MRFQEPLANTEYVDQHIRDNTIVIDAANTNITNSNMTHTNATNADTANIYIANII